MYFSPVSLSLASAFFFASAHATYLNNDLSFGHNGKISPNMRAVPNWHLMGKPNPPEILSNKLVLTPPAPGNQRGAAWSEKTLQHSLWNVDVDFRATGPERGGGNFNVWYVRNGREEVGTSSIYTAGRFDGLALVIDQYAGSGGFIRGFLNDGTTEYKSHHSVDSLAFGHCTYSYRNLGRPSRLAIRQGPDTFRVEVDGKLCFDSPKIKLPAGNYFGITAASAENPDSFEVFKVVTTTDSHVPDVVGHSQEPYIKDIHGAPSHHEEVKKDEHSQQQVHNQQHGDIPSYHEDTPASQYHSSAEQFADLHNRLQLMMKHISTLNRDLQTYQTLAAERHESLMTRIHSIEASVKVQEGNPHVMRDIQSDVRQTKADLHNALDAHVAGLKTAVRDSHHSVLGTLAKSGTGLGKFVLVVILSQVVVVGAYVIYKRRKSGGHMKYL
ncbi:concanavalin A-like lectin/glucanase domain-containing protein [Tricladium varicosporioides]|nr:concanavalin A-like lectin/glucanase domain-containing protein [Hymenoscyphus varicosporioides]